MRNLLAIVLSLMFLIGTASVIDTHKVHALGNTAIIGTTDKTGYYVGDTVKVFITGQNIFDLNGVEFTLNYDASLLKLQGNGIVLSPSYEAFGGEMVDTTNGVLSYDILNKNPVQLTKTEQIGEIDFTVLKSGIGTIRLSGITAVDGNLSQVQSNTQTQASFSVGIQLPAPTMAANITAPTNTDVLVMINFPAEATVKEYKVGVNGVWTAYKSPVAVSANTTVFARGTGAAGNVSNVTNYVVNNIDKIPPTITDDAPKNWVNQNTTVTLCPTDDSSGVANTFYTVDGGAQQSGTSVVLTTEGMHTLIYWSVDKAGNIEAQHTATVQIDKTAPITTGGVNPTKPDGLNGWYTHSVAFSLSATDEKSGVAKTEYSLEGGNTWKVYSSPVTLNQDGKYTVSYRSIDIAGNVELENTVSIYLDGTAPVIVVTAPTESSYSDDGDLSPLFTVTDNLSGVDNTKTIATLDGQNVAQGTTIPLYTLLLGPHTFVVTASDLAGNAQNTTVTFLTYANLDSLKALVTRFAGNHWIDNVGITNSLQKKLDEGDVGEFIHEVKAQTGKHMTTEAAIYLLRDAQAIIDSLKAKVNQFTNDKSIDRADVAKDLLDTLKEGNLKDFAHKVQELSGKHISLDAAKSLLQ